MRQLILFCAALCLSAFVHAQTAKFDNNKNINFDSSIKLKVTLSDDRLFIVYNNKEIRGASIQVLDSLLKKVPDLKQLSVEFEGINAEPEKKRSVDTVLKQCQCPVARHFKSLRRLN